jgi:hypothetical protein
VEPVCDSDALPLIAEGEYEAVCVSACRYTHPAFKREVIELSFRVVLSDFESVKLKRYYNAAMAHKRGSDYFREWTIANQGNAPKRKDRMSWQRFRCKLFRVRVVTVKQSRRQLPLPCSLQYSKIAAVLELLATNDTLRRHDNAVSLLYSES